MEKFARLVLMSLAKKRGAGFVFCQTKNIKWLKEEANGSAIEIH